MTMQVSRPRGSARFRLFFAAGLTLSVLAAGALPGCAGDSAVRRDSPDYSVGYSDGCATGAARGSRPPRRPVRDEDAFRRNADYKAGWRTGYTACAVPSDDRDGGINRF